MTVISKVPMFMLSSITTPPQPIYTIVMAYINSVGGVMSLNAGILPALEQLGLYEELQKVSLPATGAFNIYKGDMSLIANVKNEFTEM